MVNIREMNRDVGDAVETLVLGPIYAFVIGILFLMVAKIYLLLEPRGTNGPFADAYRSLGASLSTSYSLFQLASSIETWIAVAVIALAVYGFFATLGGGGRGGYPGR